ncbi:enoyl-CoA hydratase/isomerase family protein [Rhodospirillum rubrum]|uniref:3-hydroxyisobutyryl-CoA hydrolase n=1 Tax=Rhodospirillum rubrum (strain ATCC 11170 / ATH 1.1.1 / DSM 467 / LMG 4362 / NCIMB 8255 / S1) TaxID=269796 RepID=Q2RTB1_RHORT|nr:enoyl-CoA hydratase/isomerase family protein [Rhodospirillum rubrum]ABC22634.1 Enoyl-CoA hydratase/isomerase [Rhodospirillum rubrum ATCC 11170]AEO48352.1 enoyl-CoA hydratase/isomerase [Rhodospirillum rubrum F11]MBK5954231.1 enoyl-CoA hydratase [Rhodospirillum rubrum]QXG82256.1 enoyl-CoA hydratase/isomerase family protein [Rhodospirillum rubrum]HAP99190.1 enoyl-CoA hydratase/isomerase family protein [Rhodospirillum rubrum]
MSDDDILFEQKGALGAITLNRPRALNALTLPKVERMDRALRAWATDKTVGVVTVEGSGGRAFCAGGDVRALAEVGKNGASAFLDAFFGQEYRLNRLIKTYPKPYVALLGGITMGGGVGISIHGRFPVATEATLIAMPETGIGMFPDVGGTYFLPRCPGATGVYLALTGARIGAADAVALGLCTHHIPLSALEAVKEALAALDADAGADGVKAVLDGFHRDPGEAPLAPRRAAIARCFGQPTLEDILAALASEAAIGDRAWAEETRAGLLAKSPFATRVTFEQLRRGATLDFDGCMALEYRMAPRIARHPDFIEGVRALLVDKDNQPRWSAKALAEVEDAAVGALFAPRADGDLEFRDP